jgi:hypothetical protein
MPTRTRRQRDESEARQGIHVRGRRCGQRAALMVGVHGSMSVLVKTDLWVWWADIAAEQRGLARAGRAELLRVSKDPAPQYDLSLESSPALIAVAGASHAIDAFYGEVRELIPISRSLADAWDRNPNRATGAHSRDPENRLPSRNEPSPVEARFRLALRPTRRRGSLQLAGSANRRAPRFAHERKPGVSRLRDRGSRSRGRCDVRRVREMRLLAEARAARPSGLGDRHAADDRRAPRDSPRDSAGHSIAVSCPSRAVLRESAERRWKPLVMPLCECSCGTGPAGLEPATPGFGDRCSAN